MATHIHVHDNRRKVKDVDTSPPVSGSTSMSSSTAGGMGGSPTSSMSLDSLFSNQDSRYADGGPGSGRKGHTTTHPRNPSGSAGSGQFTRKSGSGASGENSYEQAYHKMSPAEKDEFHKTYMGQAMRQRMALKGTYMHKAMYGTMGDAAMPGTPTWKPKKASGFGGAAAAKSHPEGFVQGVGPRTSKPRPPPEQYRGYDRKSTGATVWDGFLKK